jgi:hypothetical protein
MKRIVILSILVVAAVFAASLARPHTPAEDWSPVVYPEQRLPLSFSHANHLKRGTPCAACHPDAATSRSAVDNLIPTELQCRACHPIDRAQPEKVVAGAPPARCAACHPGYTPDVPVQRVYIAPPPLKFSHAAHAKQTCASCHGDLTKVDLATRAQLPTMSSCLSCHRDGAQERRCADCHLAKLGGLLETEYPQGRLMPRHTGLGDAHGPGFGKDHAQEARQVDATCTACHDRSTCLACHQGVTKPEEFHPGNYILSHAIEARRGTPDCSACHRAQSFCVGCHEREGIGLRGNRGFFGGDPTTAFHPTGWSSATGGPNRHAGEARRNIATCASCHREDDCLACHSAEVGALRASPHPRGWRGSARCRSLDRGNRRMCLKCHVTQDEVGCDWSSRR